MVSFIIIAKEKTKREVYTKEFAKKHQIDFFDITRIEKDTNAKPPTQSIGIEVVKQIQKKVFLKPIKSQNKLLVIEDAQLLTIEAQNALLKVLEEPPANTIIFLGTDTREALLPTIISRCQIISLEEEQKKVSEKTIDELNTFIESLPILSIGERLKHAEKLAKDKDKTLQWIENLILVLRDEMISSIRHSRESGNPEKEWILDFYKRTNFSRSVAVQDDENSNTKTHYTLDTLRKLQALHTLLKTTNVNPRFAIEHTLLSL